MKRLIIVDGASGTGKSDMISYFAHKPGLKASVIKKYTTREKRPEEERSVYSDLFFPPLTFAEFNDRVKSDPEFRNYRYGNDKTGKNLYGVSLSDIKSALTVSDIALLIVRDKASIQAIKNDLPDIECISVFLYTDREQVVARLRSESYTEADIDFRLQRLPAAWSDYVKASSFYDYVIVNNSSQPEFYNILDSFIEKIVSEPPTIISVAPYTRFPLPSALVGYKSKMKAALERSPYEKNVFLMMKFRPSNKDLYEFVKGELSKVGYNCVRADEPEWDLTRNTYNPVAVLYCCKFGIALFDEPEKDNAYSPNVAYELGIMHSHLKECLILRHDSLGPAPFDLVKEFYENYSRDLAVRPIIERWVRKIALL